MFKTDIARNERNNEDDCSSSIIRLPDELVRILKNISRKFCLITYMFLSSCIVLQRSQKYNLREHRYYEEVSW